MHTTTTHSHATGAYPAAAGCAPCEITAPFSRNNYFTGKLMLERDFTDEQRYHVDKLRLHHQRLHGWGVVCGLRVVADTNPACRDRYVTVEPGLAIDCCGREIVVTETVRVDITRLPSYPAITAADAPPARALQLCIRYRECGTDTIPVLYDECAWDNDKCAPNRISESYEFDLLAPDEPPVGPGHHHNVSLGLVRMIRLDRATRLAADAATDRLYVATKPVPGTDSVGDLFQLALGSETVLSAADLLGAVRDIAISPDGDMVYVLREGNDDGGDPRAFVDVYDAAAIDEDPVTTADLDSLVGKHAALAVTATRSVVALVDETLVVLDATLAMGLRVDVPGGQCLAAASGGDVVNVAGAGGVIVSVDTAASPLATAPVITLPGGPDVLDLATLVVEGADDDLIALTAAPALVLVSGGLPVNTATAAAGASRLGVADDGARAAVAGTAGAQLVSIAQLRAGTATLRVPLPIGAGIGADAVFDDGDVLVVADLAYVAVPGDSLATGGVAVLGTVGSLNCDDLLWRSTQSCPECDDPGCIVLATMLDYDAGDRLVDAGTASVGSTEVEIDNRVGRTLLVSTQTLTELVECLLARPTPAGGSGRDGIDGQDGAPGRDGKDGVNGVDGTDGVDGVDGQNGVDGQDGIGMELGLVQIRALSWLHRGGSPAIDIQRVAGETQRGLAIGFTDMVTTKGLDDHIFRVHVDHTNPDESELGFRCVCELRGEVVPIEPKFDGDRIAEGIELPAGDQAEAIAFIPAFPFEAVIERGSREVRVELHGEFVLDADDPQRAIDAEFTRAEFPTGDRPAGSKAGVQGGLFQSWFHLGREVVPPDAGRVNFASRALIEAVPGIGATFAARIVNERRRTPFVDADDFRARVKPPEHLWERMRDHLDFTPPPEA